MELELGQTSCYYPESYIVFFFFEIERVDAPI